MLRPGTRTLYTIGVIDIGEKIMSLIVCIDINDNAAFDGDLDCDVNGDLDGDVVGDLDGDVAGDLDGDVAGDGDLEKEEKAKCIGESVSTE